MTASVGNSPASGTEALLQSVTGRITAGRRGSKNADDGASGRDDDQAQGASSKDIKSSDVQVGKSATTSKGKIDKEKSNDDGSFEDAFKSVDQNESEDAPAQPTKAEPFPTDLILAQMAAGGASTAKAEVTTPVETAQSAIGPTALQQQKSLLALIDAKGRLFATDDMPKTGSKTDNNATASIDGNDSDDGEIGQTVRLTLNRRETHWNFTSETMTRTTAQLSALQLGGSALPAAAAASSQSGAMLFATKESMAEGKLPADGTQQTTQKVIGTFDSSPTLNPSFTNSDSSDQGNAQPQLQSGSPIPTPKKASKADSASALDRIFSSDGSSPPVATSATTQVRNAVVGSLAQPSADVTTPAGPLDVAQARPSTAPVVKTLDLTLSPPELGDVKLRLSLKSNSLTIEAEASHASTAKLLVDDRQNLERGLKDAGYDVSSVKIADASATSQSNTGGWQSNGSTPRDGDQPRSGFTGRDAEMQRRDDSGSSQSERRPREQNPQIISSDTNGSRSGNAVYI